MNERSPLEARIAALITAYADRAPADVDPLAMTRFAAADQARSSRTWAGFVSGFAVAQQARWLAFVVILLALLVTLVGGALIAGGRSVQEPEDLLTGRTFVAPFTGLPPEGAQPSMPESGELVVSFAGRVDGFGGDFHRMWLYADGRLIWKSNLDGLRGSSGDTRFGANGPTTAVIEQRLTPEGVDLLLSEVMASAKILGPAAATDDPVRRGRPGVIWGAMHLGDGARLLDASWGDARLPARLAAPAAWLPPSAWADRSISGFVPSHYAVCVEPISSERPLGALPAATRELIESRATRTGDPRCGYQVSTADARTIAARLEDAGLPREPYMRWRLTTGESSDAAGWVELLPVTPNGEYVCNCG